MKGTFFSADFVRDSNGGLRLIEVNTDTGIVASQKSIFDWSSFKTILETNSISKINVIYKYDIQNDIVDSLNEYLTANAPFITQFIKTIVAGDSIFPPVITDSSDTFILRMAYDETAILDSEYAKGTLNLLKLFADNGGQASTIGFYHSSSLYGSYNTLDTTLTNPSNVPDFVTKTVIEEMQPHNFYKLGQSTLNSPDRINGFVNEINNENIIIEQYHMSPSNITNGMATSIRSFQIVYGSDLSLCYAAQFEINATLELPSSIEVDDTKLTNLIPSKHYYEFATNYIKNENMGFLGYEKVMDVNGNAVEIQNTTVDQVLQSYYVDGAPNTDDFDLLREWKYTGDTLPSGSFLTSSYVANKFSTTTYANDMISINFEDGAQMYIGGETRVLSYDTVNNIVEFQKVLDLTPDYAIFTNNGGHVKISSIDAVIFENPQDVWIMDMQEIHNFVLETNGFMALLVVHNALYCFPAGTQITMADGTTKNIEDVIEGDEVLSYNEKTLQNEVKKVIGTKQPVHSDLVKYHLSNDTELTCTFDHPVYVNGSDLSSFIPEWTNKRYDLDKKVDKIKVGDLLTLTTNSQVAVKEIEVLDPVDTQTYIITVEDNHNFFANGVLVHNK